MPSSVFQIKVLQVEKFVSTLFEFAQACSPVIKHVSFYGFLKKKLIKSQKDDETGKLGNLGTHV